MDKRTTGYCALGLLLISAVAPIRAQTDARPDDEARISKEKARRVIEVQSVSEGIGVSSGLVVAYGHPIEAPYHIEYRGPLLFVNGIQVEPSLVLQRENDENRPKLSEDDRAEFKELEEMNKAVRQYYLEHKGKMPEADLREKILSMVRANTRVKDAEWTADRGLIYHPKGKFENIANSVSFSPPRAANPKHKSQDELKQEHVADLERHLKNGGCIFWGTTGPWFRPEWQCKNIRRSVREVMESPSLSDAGREQKLKDLLVGSDPALDTMANYKRSEWK